MPTLLTDQVTSLLDAREEFADARDDEQDMRRQEQDAQDGVQEVGVKPLILAMTLVADGCLQVVQGRVQVPLDHYEALRLVWREIRPAIVRLVALRDGWSRDIARMEDCGATR